MARTFLYFAYGSNLLAKRLLLKNPTAQFLHTARLDDYRLTFDSPRATHTMPWAGAPATIRRCPGSCVWGVIWQLDMADSDNLDSMNHNGCDLPSELDMADSDNLDMQEVFYQRRTVTVTTPDGTTYTCRTYELDGEFDISHTPSPQYKDVIVRGAKQSGLPQAYISQLEAIEDNGFQGEIQVYNTLICQLEKQQQQ
ncbi:LOW QUALITY PROTEIN: gamma-glutamylcyclotransferase-like [Haliotis rubra]|uniref:LOW QUALITY PROTEIN: gamma-glutamylcyclotransferase-like n=1 Tax=Haliotis rubra TaxID=36100 RepID=UPI001EE583E8|nr:LOW QUALITY PROTEIN: gamma-glutamylcyclotransferase-like [Haliotis rubra]